MVPVLSIDYTVPKTPLFTGGAGPIIADELHAAVESGVNALRNEIVPLVPVNLGVLRQGVQVSLTGESVDITGRVFDLVPYALAVEEGSRPHFPPTGPIELWVKRKLGIADEREAHSVAFLIARKISKTGTAARHFFRDGFQRAEPQIRARFDEALLRIKRRLTGEA